MFKFVLVDFSFCGLGEGAVATSGQDFSRSRSEAQAVTKEQASVKDWPQRYVGWYLLTFSIAKQPCGQAPHSGGRRIYSSFIPGRGGANPEHGGISSTIMQSIFSNLQGG